MAAPDGDDDSENNDYGCDNDFEKEGVGQHGCVSLVGVSFSLDFTLVVEPEQLRGQDSPPCSTAYSVGDRGGREMMEMELMNMLTGGQRTWVEGALLLSLFWVVIMKPERIWSIGRFRAACLLFGIAI